MKKFYSILTLILFFCFTGGAQVIEDSTTHYHNFRQGKTTLGFFVSPDYCNEMIRPVIYAYGTPTNAYHRQIADSFKTITKFSVSYSAGFDAVFYFNRKLALKTGIYYAVQVRRYNGFRYWNGFYGSNTYFHLQEYKTEKISLLEVPFTLNYFFARSKKILFNGFGGVLFAMNCAKDEIGTSRFWDATQPLPTTEDGFISGNRVPFSILYAGVMAGLRIDFLLRCDLALSVSPSFKYFPLTFGSLWKGNNTPGDIYTIPYSAGCGIGLTYFLK